jgi:membrane protease YdiL (CAAX protease family)
MMCVVEMTPSAASSATPMGGRRRHFDSPVTDWPWWLAPLALVLALILAVFASLIVDIPLALLGVHVNASKPPGAVVVLDTVIQDAIFVGTAVLLAGMGVREVASWQFGLRPTPRWRAAGLILLALLAFLIFVAVWSQLVHAEKDKVLEKLGAKEGTELLLASAALTCVVAPICEELLFRGFVFTSLRNLRGPWLAALLTGLLFGAVHITSAPVIDLLPLAALGFLLCVLYRATGSLYPCIAVHAINNAVAFGALEKWTWQIVVLLLASLGCIALLVLAARRLGLVRDGQGEWETSAPGG